MSFRRFPAVWAVLLASLVPATSWAQAGLADRVPNDANAIVMLNVDKIMASPIAQKNNWREARENAAAAGLSILPVSATSFVMASKLDFEFMQPIWEVSLAAVSYEPSMPKIAARWGGNVERIAGRNAARLPDDSYVVQLGPSKVAAMRPANRQNVSRWLKQTDTTRGHQLSPYLDGALAYNKKLGTPIIMAIDMQDMVSPDVVRKTLDALESLKGRDVDLDELAEAISSIRGVTLGLNIKDNVSGAMVIDFDQDVSQLKGLAKPLLLHVLSSRSAMIDEFNDWEEVVEGKRVRVRGRLFRSGLQRILSVLDTPASLQELAPTSPGEMPDETTTAKLASQQYFHSVSGLVDDLRKKPNKKTSGQVGIWYEKYSRKIDGLPMVNVDPLLLDYGQFVSSSFREAGGTLRNVGGTARVRQMNEAAGSNYGRWGVVGPYGNFVSGYSGNFYPGYGVNSDAMRQQAQDRARIRTEERVQGARTTREIMQDVDAATSDIRRKMIEKYQAEF